MDSQRGRAELIEAFAAARERETNGAFLAIRVEGAAAGGASGTRGAADTGVAADPRVGAAVRTACRGGPEASVIRLGGPVHGCIVPSCSAAEARALAEAIRRALAPAAASIGIANFYRLFNADGTAAEIAKELERIARQRLDIARREPGGVCDATDPSNPAHEDRPSVFLIEPDPVSVELLTAALDAAGFDVSSFQNGEAAMASLEASPPGLVICEAMTPRLNGFVIRERLRASPRLAAIPFVLVSHRKTEDLIRRAVELDIRHFFRKPLSIVEIVGLATNLIRRPSS